MKGHSDPCSYWLPGPLDRYAQVRQNQSLAIEFYCQAFRRKGPRTARGPFCFRE
jgi:hypothetical protein